MCSPSCSMRQSTARFGQSRGWIWSPRAIGGGCFDFSSRVASSVDPPRASIFALLSSAAPPRLLSLSSRPTTPSSALPVSDVPRNADTLQTAQYFIFVTQIHFCAMYAIIVWDWFFGLQREYRFIWKTSWTPVKVAYLFCRYWVLAVVPYLLYAFAVNHTEETCQRIFKIPVALAMWNQVAAESILLIRTYAFFNRNIYVLVLLVSALSGVVAYQLYVATSQMDLLPFMPPHAIMGPCFPMSKPHSAHLLGFFIAPLLYDTMVTFMTIGKAITIRRRNGGPSSRLIQTFLREGVFYYILISIANLVNGIFYLQPRQAISAICIPLSVMLSPVLACRLILDLRERGSETVSQSAGTIAFTAGPTSSKSSPGSPFSGLGFGFGMQGRSGSKAIVRTQGVVLSTIGSIPGDTLGTTSGMEMDNIHYQKSDIEAALYTGGVSLGSPVSGIRVDVEKTTM
ncbi:hypothetical protein DICSQDRAFT_164921 [Dichomitus squalens LYAD-421 SS1]|uniref:uncharacterized protein n=1 Tax=Dichomitus squalens (strain LYAD-421) TaxID=732165 RepID=UPI0004415FDA|nr:uncharacterized protein DICSQDRAFT_164921 [Dichomitus squalens LYAD-421 SS1]EJF67084.1 hypothetical protein DICSQDRAFT_164921 [Dichomitus squalens LYAD-421 SS1]